MPHPSQRSRRRLRPIPYWQSPPMDAAAHARVEAALRADSGVPEIIHAACAKRMAKIDALSPADRAQIWVIGWTRFKHERWRPMPTAKPAAESRRKRKPLSPEASAILAKLGLAP